MIFSAVWIVLRALNMPLCHPLARMQDLLVTPCQFPAVPSLHTVLQSSNRALFGFELKSFILGELARSLACINTTLLIDLANVYRSVGGDGGG